jgi:hypothetical protein
MSIDLDKLRTKIIETIHTVLDEVQRECTPTNAPAPAARRGQFQAPRLLSSDEAVQQIADAASKLGGANARSPVEQLTAATRELFSLYQMTHYPQGDYAYTGIRPPLGMAVYPAGDVRTAIDGGRTTRVVTDAVGNEWAQGELGASWTKLSGEVVVGPDALSLILGRAELEPDAREPDGPELGADARKPDGPEDEP